MKPFFLVPILLSAPSTSAWLPRSSIENGYRKLSGPQIASLRSSGAEGSNTLGGVSSFESWFRNVEGADSDEGLFHGDFGNLRGLSYGAPIGDSSVMTIPKSIVLDSDFGRPDWDARLASKLWAECERGSSGPISGYVELLSRSEWTPADLPSIPPSTAPDSIRHWTDDQLALLEAKPEGERLLGLMRQQEQIWEQKFSDVGGGMTWEQFRWAMEVVHSRAFCGDFGINSGIPKPLLVGLPALAGFLGYYYYVVQHGQNDIILALLALVAGIPVVFSALVKDSPAAVLLPLIDSANHMEDADSMIAYNQLGESFGLTVGEKCVVDTNGKKQLFISYGKKKDTELLLNYGFLQGVDISDGDSDARRQKLAEVFLSRQ